MKINQLAVFFILVYNFSFAQNVFPEELTKEHLNQLTRANPSDLKNQQIVIDGVTFPVYNAAGKRIKGKEMRAELMSNKYVTNFYVDAQKNIKIAVLQDADVDELKFLSHTQTQTSSGIESQLVGTSASAFSVTDINGKTYSLNSLKSKTIVINFWFTTCAPCLDEIPELNRIVEHYKTRNDIVFLAMATDTETDLKAFLKTHPYHYHQIANSMDFAKDFAVFAFPTHIIINNTGKIVYHVAGFSDTSVKELEEALKIAIQ